MAVGIDDTSRNALFGLRGWDEARVATQQKGIGDAGRIIVSSTMS
jgi:hypothetical protein